MTNVPPSERAASERAAFEHSAARWLRVAGLIVLLAAAIAAGVWAYRDLARRSDALDARMAAAVNDVSTIAQQAVKTAGDADRRIEDLARELESVKSQRAALDQLYLELTRGRDEAALFDIERLITLAAQDLRLTGHVPAALNALQAADARLVRLDRPQYVNLRRALSRDIEKLRATPAVDVTGIALKLDQIAQTSDGWAMLSDPAIKPAPARSSTRDAAKDAAKDVAKSAKPVPPPEMPALSETTLGTIWLRVRNWLASEFGDLVRIRDVETPESILLDGVQQQLVRQQFKLRLLDARHALLARNDRVFRSDLAEAQALITRYFDVKQPAAGSALLQLKQLAQSPLNVDLPSLDESLAALRTARPALAR